MDLLHPQPPPPLPLPAAPGPPYYGFVLPQPQQGQQQKRKKRGKRGSKLGPNTRSLKQQHGPQQLGFFGQVPNLQELRQENRWRTQQHYGNPRAFPQPGQPSSYRPQQQPPPQQHGSGRQRRFRPKGPKQPKVHQPTPQSQPLTPAAPNPLDTPANVGKADAAALPAGVDRLEAEGLQPGLDWFGTNENSAALFLAGEQATTSDSEFDHDGVDEEDEGASDGDMHSGGGAAVANGHGAGGAAVDDTQLPQHVQARLVEQEAYIAELEDQNLRLREQLEMLQQEMQELRGHGRGAGDSEEGYAEHSEGSLPGDLSVMQHPHHH